MVKELAVLAQLVDFLFKSAGHYASTPEGQAEWQDVVSANGGDGGDGAAGSDGGAGGAGGDGGDAQAGSGSNTTARARR